MSLGVRQITWAVLLTAWREHRRGCEQCGRWILEPSPEHRPCDEGWKIVEEMAAIDNPPSPTPSLDKLGL